ncbi:MAG: hypothetical protein HY937_04540 [Nitrosomonadales bacterium]|nr:hypothetical protein [Nitrosomonadales bacterium]
MRVTLPESHRGVLAWLALTVFACYCNALSGAFQFDDYKIIVDNPVVHSWEAWLANLGHGIRPLLKFSYTLNWTSGLGAAGFHLTNLLIHLCNAYLVYRLSGEFVQQQPLRDRLKDVPLFTALLFAAHPIHTEAVTYICGRSISLMMLFYLAGLLAYVAGRAQHNKISVYLITPLLFVTALSVKETAVTFPLALLAWELGCGGTWKASLRQQWPNWAVLLLGVMFFLLNDNYLAQMERSAKLNSLRGNAATQLFAFSYLMRQWALPLWLNIDPDLPLLHDATGFTLPLIFFAAAFALMLACWRRRPWIGFALAWAMIQLIPLYLFLPRVDVANDRQMVLADWPLFLALTAEMALIMHTRTLRIAAAALLLTLACLTVLRNQVYASEIALWEDTVKQSPHKARVHNNLGYAYMLAHRNEDARREFTAALQFDPHYYKARNNLERLNNQ